MRHPLRLAAQTPAVSPGSTWSTLDPPDEFPQLRASQTRRRWPWGTSRSAVQAGRSGHTRPAGVCGRSRGTMPRCRPQRRGGTPGFCWRIPPPGQMARPADSNLPSIASKSTPPKAHYTAARGRRGSRRTMLAKWQADDARHLAARMVRRGKLRLEVEEDG